MMLHPVMMRGLRHLLAHPLRGGMRGVSAQTRCIVLLVLLLVMLVLRV
jgi:hypothetical protein